MFARSPSWFARLSLGCLAVLMAAMQTLLVAHAAEHRHDPRADSRATLHGTCGHNHGDSTCSLCRLIAQSTADSPPRELRIWAQGGVVPDLSARAAENPRAVKFWICTGPRGPPGFA